jgi:hypothetical protein
MIEHSRPDLAPGCFGSALAFKEESSECAGCPFQTACAPVSCRRLEKLRAELGLTDLVSKPRTTVRSRQHAHSAADGDLTTVLPKKVQALLERIEARGINVGAALRDGKNPFERPAFLKVAAHLLLRLPNGFDRSTLRMALQHKLEWSEQTAASHASQVFHVLQALGVAKEVNGRLMRIAE